MSKSPTFMAKREQVQRAWYVIDATDKPLGRMASRVAAVLQGKHRPTYTPHVDTGDFVVIINADKVKLTGRKRERTFVYSHSGYKGSLKAKSYGEIMDKNPEKLVERVVKGMLPRNRLSFHRKLKVYSGPYHPHTAQKPQPLEL